MTQLMPHQVETVEYCTKNPYVIVALEPGLGKTLVALSTAHNTRSKALVVMPSYLRLNWVKEIKKFFPDKVITQFKKGAEIYHVWDSDIVLLPYSFLTHEKADLLFEWADLVIVDEAHHVKGMEAKRTTALHKLVFENSIKRLLLLTGTPIVNRVYEFYSLMALCNYRPGISDGEFLKKFPSYIDFADYFSHRREYDVPVGNWYRTVCKWEGIKNTEELKKHLKGIFIQKKAKDVLDLPESIYKDILFSEKPDPALLEAFTRMWENDSSMPQYKAQAAVEKVPMTLKYLDETLENERVVIFTDHRESCRQLAAALKVPAITGEMSADERIKHANNFEKGLGTRLVATIGSLSTGVDLVSANHVVFNDFPWVPASLRQAEGRIKRMGQTKTCHFHRILASPQDEYILSVIQAKEEVIKEALNAET